MGTQTFPFRFTPAYRLAALPFGIVPRTAQVTVSDEELAAQLGVWHVRTPRSNIESAEVTGPYSYIKTAGPAHLSLADRGLSFATSGSQGVCIRFREPVPGIEPTGRIRHPSLTVTVADCDGLVALLSSRG